MCTFLDRFRSESHQWFVCTWQTNYVVERFISQSSRIQQFWAADDVWSKEKNQNLPLKHLKRDLLWLHTNATNQIIQTCNKPSIQILTANKKSVNCCIRKLKKKHTREKKSDSLLITAQIFLFYFLFISSACSSREFLRTPIYRDKLHKRPTLSLNDLFSRKPA